MSARIPEPVRGALAEIARRRGLDLLVLFGSRAKGTSRPDSDWDFAYQAALNVDHFGLLADLCDTLCTERVDLVDLRHANGLLQNEIAACSALVFERTPGALREFQLQSGLAWGELEFVVGSALEAALARIHP